ncbi:MAG: YggT family protein [Alphaproteobacteria bacterium]
MLALNPVIVLIGKVIYLVSLTIIVWAILSILLNFDVINRSSPIVMKVYGTLDRLCEPLLRPFRKLQRKLMPGLPVDLSPVIVVLLLTFLDDEMYTLFYKF